MKTPISYYDPIRAIPFSVLGIIFGIWFLSIPYTIYHFSASMFRDKWAILWPIGAIGTVYLIITSLFTILSVMFFRCVAVYGGNGKLAITQPLSMKLDVRLIESLDIVPIMGSYNRVKISINGGKVFYLSPFLTKDTCETLIEKIQTFKNDLSKSEASP